MVGIGLALSELLITALQVLGGLAAAYLVVGIIFGTKALIDKAIDLFF